MKTVLRILLFFLIFFSLVGCTKEEFNEYYDRPDSLEDPIYQVLEGRGDFTTLTSVIAKAGYKDILGESGYWTMFAPNDEAFNSFLQDEGISSVDNVDSTMAVKIVKYALVYNAYRTERLPDYQPSGGWLENAAFKRRTAYYDGFQKKTIEGNEIVVVSSNRNTDAEGENYYVSGDNNNKYISYFSEEFMRARGLGAYDYNYFYPNQELTSLNVMNSMAVDTNIVAENGIIHEVSKVVLPPVNLDQYIEENEEYSLFYNLMEDKLITYEYNKEASDSYYNFTGNSEDVYVKVYNQALAFSPNNENYLIEDYNDGQSNGYSMFVPQNEVFQEFIDNVLLKHYSSLDQLPLYIFQDLYNAHMWPSAVWPSRYQSTRNGLEEEARFNLESDVVDAQLLSNGFFYGTNKVQASNYFYSVYTSPYLDPDYTLMTRALNDTGSDFRGLISNINRQWTLFMMSDEVLNELGYSYDIDREEWVYVSPINENEVRGSLAKERIIRVLFNHIIFTPNGELNDLSGSGIVRTGDNELPGEYIKYENGTVYAAGNEALENVVNITGYEDQNNGRVYFTDNILEFSEEAPGVDIKELAEEPDSEYEYFFNFLQNSQLYDSDGSTIAGVTLGTKHTFLIPNNDAIQQAVDDGVLPATETGEPDFDPSEILDQQMVTEFIQLHIITTQIISDDGKTTGDYPTLLKDDLGNPIYLTASSVPGELSFTDSNGRQADIIPSASNNLADRSLIHLIDNYFSYTE